MKKLILETGGEAFRPQARTSDLVVRELPDEELVYDLKTNQAHCLTQTAAAVWKQCDGQQTMAEIATRVQQETRLLMDDAMVRLALHHLDKANLLEPRMNFSPPKPGLLRREVLRRIGFGAAAAVPLVTSIIAPLSVQAASCGDPNNNLNQNAVGCACNGADDCASNCCGFSAAIGNICVTPNSVPSGSPCRAGCECASGSCSGSPRRCT